MVIKSIVKIYMLILVLIFSLELLSSLDYPEVWLWPATWLNWLVNLMAVFALGLFAFRNRVFSLLFWRIVLLIMISNYGYQLFNLGLFSDELDLLTKIVVVANYLFLVLPGLFVVSYFAFSQKSVIND